MASSSNTDEPRRHRGIVLSPPGTDSSNWNQYEYSMMWILKQKKLWYLLDYDPIKIENGLRVSSEIITHDNISFFSQIIESIHPDNIDALDGASNPKDMWNRLKPAHLHESSGSRYFLLRSLMAKEADSSDDIPSLIIDIQSLGAKLKKLCKNGLISVEDIQVAALTSALPDSFVGVTSSFEQQEDVKFADVAKAVNSHVLNRKNRTNNQTSSISKAQIAQSSESITESKNKNRRRKKPSKKSSNDTTSCTHCNSRYHSIDACLIHKNDTLSSRVDALMKKMESMGHAKLAHDSDSDSSDYSESMARTAISLSTPSALTARRMNVDSGCSDTLVPGSWSLDHPQTSSLILRTANNSKIKAIHKGTTSITSSLPKVLAHQVPGLAEPLLSVSDVTNSNVAVVFFKDSVLFISDPSDLESHIRSTSNLLAEGRRENKSYYLYDNTRHLSFRTSPSPAASYMTWHLRLSHLNLRALQDLRRRGEIIVNVDDSEDVVRCEECVKGKLSRLSNRSRVDHKAGGLLDRVHSDLYSLLTISSRGSKYIMTFVDEFSHFAVIYFLKNKSQAFGCFQHFVKYAERVTERKMKRIRSDNGGEYTSSEWEKYCSDSGISHSRGPPHSPQLNGIAERFNRTLLDRILPSLFHAKLPVSFWEAAARHSVSSLNLSPSRTNPAKSSPHSLWTSTPASYKRLRTFGCHCHRLITGPSKGGKLSQKSSPSLFMYGLENGDGWMVYDIQSKKEVKSHDVVFFEGDFPGLSHVNKRNETDWLRWTSNEHVSNPRLPNGRHSLWDRRLSASMHNPARQTPPGSNSSVISDNCPPASPSTESHTPSESLDRNGDSVSDQAPATPEDAEADVSVNDREASPSPPPHDLPAPRRGTRTRHPPDRYGFRARQAQCLLAKIEKSDVPLLKSMVTAQDPESFKEAIKSHHCDDWLIAMQSEIDSLISKRVFDLVPLPKGKRAIGCRWAFRTKMKDGRVERRKARLVAKGYLQKKGVDYHETYAPSTRAETIRLVMSHMVTHAWDSRQMDVMTAFLNSCLQEEVYLKQPEGFVDVDHPDWVWRVRASLYGLKQAPREWNNMLTGQLLSQGLEQSKHDPVLFTKKREGKVIGAVLAHVDDLYVTGEPSFVNNESQALENGFKMSKSGPLDTYLSLKVERGVNREVFISQTDYIDQVVEAHLPPDSKPAFVPCNAFFSDMSAQLDQPETIQPYSALIGKMQWLANGSRPDVQFAINRLSQFLCRPTDSHWNSAIHVLRYLNTTKCLRLCLGTEPNQALHGFSDADWASTTEDRRSTTGWVFKYGGGPVSWKSRSQPTVALSTTEGEYMAMSDATKEALWLKGVLSDLGVEDKSICLHYDNQGAGCLSTGEGLKRRTKHIDVRHHFIRDCITSGKIDISYTPTADMLADFLTKPLGKLKHQQAVKMLGLV